MNKNRWLIALSAIAIHLSIGGAYAYSVYKNPIMQEMGWNATNVTVAFTIMMGLAGFAAALFGSLVEKMGPRKSAMVAALLFGAGQAGAGLAILSDSVVLYWLTYGLLSGLGMGIGYIAPVSTLVKWFPDRRGLATGMAVLGFGSGALLTAPVAAKLMEAVGISNTYFILGISYFILMMLGALYIAPPAGNASGDKYATSSGIKALAQLSAKEAVRTKHFWMLWSMHLVNVTAGIMMISVASPMAQEIVGLSVAGAAAMVGLMGLFNGGGRLLWAAASDYIGRHNVFVIFFIIQLITFVTLPFTTNLIIFQLLIFLVVSCYGGGFSNLPAFASDLFGTKQLGVIHGYLLTTWSLGGVFGPIIVTTIRNATNSYIPVFYLFSFLIGLSLCISLWIRYDVKKLKKQQKEEALKVGDVSTIS
ncbi:OFA family oxalate/formate antiporter-like MFS transporter [Lysinibacillus composti]|uniref:MFS transporter n=1 Tax=Lysinibacillus composti TaxID=720633 RepID=A0A3N9UGH3_9BACI|nr:OFA family MFS transporter [Lysinibacillus composti]MBM7608212.1 OFA family oxalate/formate antiporter-like MFS transporter [Lysinibacillus composti]RQW75273.1 MFS transporter [Lysinibacillus composti]